MSGCDERYAMSGCDDRAGEMKRRRVDNTKRWRAQILPCALLCKICSFLTVREHARWMVCNWSWSNMLTHKDAWSVVSLTGSFPAHIELNRSICFSTRYWIDDRMLKGCERLLELRCGALDVTERLQQWCPQLRVLECASVEVRDLSKWKHLRQLHTETLLVSGKMAWPSELEHLRICINISSILVDEKHSVPIDLCAIVQHKGLRTLDVTAMSHMKSELPDLSEMPQLTRLCIRGNIMCPYKYPHVRELAFLSGEFCEGANADLREFSGLEFLYAKTDSRMVRSIRVAPSVCVVVAPGYICDVVCAEDCRVVRHKWSMVEWRQRLLTLRGNTKFLSLLSWMMG